MKKEIIASGKSLNEAKENARLTLGASELDDVTFEIVDLGSKGIFGIGARPTKVKASIELPDTEPRRERKASAAPRNDASKRDNVSKNGSANNGGEKRAKRDSQETKSIVIPEDDLHFEQVNAAPGDDRAFDFINTLIANLELVDVTAELLRCDDGTRRIRIKGENASMLIGHHGDTLDALQYLANLAASQKDSNGTRDRSRVTIDVEGYRAKREQTLRQLARRMAEKALAKGSKVTMEPMSPYERRIIHSEIQSIKGVTTQSTGSDSSRRIVIYVDRPGKPVSNSNSTEIAEEDILNKTESND